MDGIDARTLWHYQAIMVSPNHFDRARAREQPLDGLPGQRGEYLDGGKQYPFEVPANAAVERFWALTPTMSDDRGLLDPGSADRSSRAVSTIHGRIPSLSDMYFGRRLRVSRRTQCPPIRIQRFIMFSFQSATVKASSDNLDYLMARPLDTPEHAYATPIRYTPGTRPSLSVFPD